ncbi:uncharacterized protein MAL8P1.12 isoform X2 [Agrilus planipennis]|uniref:Uncharacterized protein MAL8P1.12 isoform X2 n=1 Tax=Agrilus planipennis TaxID=224129 RepID=A0A7F5RDX3_AGRPL|nr:uncharacterized protein MAL8P1.12 isoform X2 [Agrilus planipennis]
MGESSVRNWIRGIRFTPENYDKSVFYVDHNQKDNSFHPIISATTTNDNERKQTILQFNNKGPTMDDFRTVSFSSFKPQTERRRKINGGGGVVLETIEESSVGIPKSDCVFDNKVPSASATGRNESAVSTWTKVLHTAPLERENPEVVIGANYNGDNDASSSTVSDLKNKPVAGESETSCTNCQLGVDVARSSIYPISLSEHGSVVDDDEIAFDTSSDESCDTHGNPLEETDCSKPQGTSSLNEKMTNVRMKGEIVEEIPEPRDDNVQYSVDCNEPIYVNLAQMKNTFNIDYSSNNFDKHLEDEDDDFDFIEESMRRRPGEGLKRNTKSLRRKRYAIMDDSLRFNIETKWKTLPNVVENESYNTSVLCGTPDSAKKSNDSLDSISWKSTRSTLMVDDNIFPNRPESFPDDVSSDSVSWKSSNSFAITTKSSDSLEETKDSGTLENLSNKKKLDSTEEEIRERAVLSDFRRHAILETFNDHIYMNQRQIMQPYSYIQECIPEPTYQIGNTGRQDIEETETGSYSSNDSKSDALEDLTFTGEMCNNEISETDHVRSETIDYCNNEETYENIWECVSSSSSSNSKSGNNNSSNCSFLEAKQLSVKHALVCLQPVEFEIVNELLVAPVTFAQAAFGNVLQWQKDLEDQYCSEESLCQEYTSLENITEKKEGVSPFPTECDVEVRKKSGDRTVTNRSQTIHGYVSELENSIEDRPLNMKKVVKIYIDGTGRKIFKNQMLQIYKGEMVLLSDKGEREILRKDVNITHYKPYTNKKEIHITNTTAEECKLYKLQFDNTDDMNMILGELHKYFNNDFRGRPRSNSLTEKAPLAPQNEERVQIRHRLLKLLGRRSSKDMLEKKGIIRNEPIFGNTLNNLYSKYRVPVPPFVVKIINIIELPKNIRSLGLYRASGNLATIQKIRFQVDRNNLSILNDYMNDIDVLTGALKLFFRELNEPVIPHKTYEELLQFVDKDLHPSAIEKIKYSINKMDLPHKKTFLTLLKHLVHVEKFKQDNKMDAYNISIVWGPTLIWPPETSQENILENHTNANKIIEILLNIYRNEFLSESSSPPFSVRNRINVNAVLNGNSQESAKSSRKDLQQDSSTKTSAKSKFGSMENLFKAMKKDSVSSPKDAKWNLESLCKNSKSNIPEFLQRIVPLIEKNIEVENIYSKQLSDEKLEKIKTKISRNKYGSLEKNNVYELAATVKLFFSELDPPLIPPESFLKMVHAIGRQNEPEKSKLMRQEINKLSPCHRETLSYLFKHLVDVSRRKESNSVNVALTWMPILCKKLINTSDIRLEKCVEVVEYLMEFYDEKSATTDALMENLKNNLKAYTQNQQKYGAGCVKSLNNNNNSSSSSNNNSSSCESLSKQENNNNNNNNNNNAPSESTVKKRILKNTSALYRDSKYYNASLHPPSIYDTVPPTQTGLSSKEEARGEAKLLETDANKNVKKHERTTKL